MLVMGTGLRKDAAPPTLGAPGGRLQLVSVASPGEVVFSPLELAPDLRLDGFTQLGQLMLSQNARVDASGSGGGTVLLRGRRVEVAGPQILANTLGDIDGNRLGIDLLATEEAIFKPLGTKGAGRAGDIRLSGGHVQVDGSGNGAAEVRSTDPVKRETTGAGGTSSSR
jgi:hypothetical protein